MTISPLFFTISVGIKAIREMGGIGQLFSCVGDDLVGGSGHHGNIIIINRKIKNNINASKKDDLSVFYSFCLHLKGQRGGRNCPVDFLPGC